MRRSRPDGSYRPKADISAGFFVPDITSKVFLLSTGRERLSLTRIGIFRRVYIISIDDAVCCSV
jgi:hypothetical protein